MNTNRKKLNKCSRSWLALLNKLVTILLIAGLLAYASQQACLAQESTTPPPPQEPATTPTDPANNHPSPYQRFLWLLDERTENQRQINSLYATMPIGEIEKQTVQRRKINDLRKRNLEIENNLIEVALDGMQTTQPPQPMLIALLMNRIERRLDGKNPQFPFNPPRAIELLDSLHQVKVELPKLVSFRYYANLLTKRFKEARQVLEEAVAQGFTAPAATLPQLEQYEKDWSREAELRAAERNANDLPRVLFKTDAGDILVELLENEAPNTIHNFITLVESGFYDGRTFYKVDPVLVCQSGCPRDDGTSGPDYRIESESDVFNARQHFAGSISMLPDQSGATGSQFLIARQPLPHLDGKNTVFGRVIEGMSIVYQLRQAEPNSNRRQRQAPNQILKATVIRKRNHPYVPRKITDNESDIK